MPVRWCLECPCLCQGCLLMKFDHSHRSLTTLNFTPTGCEVPCSSLMRSNSCVLPLMDRSKAVLPFTAVPAVVCLTAATNIKQETVACYHSRQQLEGSNQHYPPVHCPHHSNPSLGPDLGYAHLLMWHMIQQASLIRPANGDWLAWHMAANAAYPHAVFYKSYHSAVRHPLKL